MSFYRNDWLTRNPGGEGRPVANFIRDNARLPEAYEVTVGSNSKRTVSDIDILEVGHAPAEKSGPIPHAAETNVHRWKSRSGLSSISCDQNNITIPISFRNFKICTARV
jgi:hypothetical protein